MIKTGLDLFQTNKNWKWELKNEKEAIAGFMIDENDYIWHCIAADPENPINWSFVYVLRDQVGKDDQFKLNGKGNSVEVMSTVVDITMTFIKEYTVSELKFFTDTNSKKSLYTRLVRRLLVGWEITYITYHPGECDVCAKNPNVKL